MNLVIEHDKVITSYFFYKGLTKKSKNLGLLLYQTENS